MKSDKVFSVEIGWPPRLAGCGRQEPVTGAKFHSLKWQLHSVSRLLQSKPGEFKPGNECLDNNCLDSIITA